MDDFSENALLQDLIYLFQGLDGKILKWSDVHQEYRMDIQVQVRLDQRKKRYVLHLVKLGSLYKQLQGCCHKMKTSHNTGLVSLSTAAALEEALADHHHAVVTWHSQVQEDSCRAAGQQELTLRRLLAMVYEPLQRMRWLVAIAGGCLGKRGGELSTCAYSFLHHGDPLVRSLVRGLLSRVCKPIFNMISRWILDGELDDPCNEFFIEDNSSIFGKEFGEGNLSKYDLKQGDILWNERYKVRKDMMPSFISLIQTKKILVAGKSINFLREICQVNSLRRKRSSEDYNSVESLILVEQEGELDSMIDTAFKDTSRHVLDVLFGQFKLLKHLKAMRAYILLGQGDFIQYFMELLEPELSKPPENVTFYRLAGIMDNALMATNGRYEDSDVLQRLDVNVEKSYFPGELGWDTFYLQYNVDGPISTILQPTKSSYRKLFRAVWRTKSTDWVLCRMWKRQITCSRVVCKIPELGDVMKQLNLITWEMVQFVHQMQYYLLFEVLECSWGEMMRQVEKAESLDDLIRSHGTFLDNVKATALIDATPNRNKDIVDVLRTVHDLAMELQTYEDDIQKRVELELEYRATRAAVSALKVGEKRSLAPPTAAGKPPTHSAFSKQHLKMDKANMTTLYKRYRHFVSQFLIDLLEESDERLHLLSSRLDFNEYFKLRYPEISHRHTHYHRRTSL